MHSFFRAYISHKVFEDSSYVQNSKNIDTKIKLSFDSIFHKFSEVPTYVACLSHTSSPSLLTVKPEGG